MTPQHKSRIRTLVFTFTFVLITFTSFSQTLNPNWKKDLDQSLQNFLQCANAPGNEKACAGYSAESLNKVYRLNDFYSNSLKRYMTVNEIAAYLKSSNQWEPLGQSFDQKTLTTAQEHANAKKAVVAVYMNAEGIGHVALITPGELKPSGSWGLSVPNAASFFTIDPSKSFVDKGLSFAFVKSMLKDLTLYARKY